MSLTQSSPLKAPKLVPPPLLAISVSSLTLTYSSMITYYLSVNPHTFSYACFATFAIVLIFTLLQYWQTHLSPLNLIIATPSYTASLNPLKTSSTPPSSTATTSNNVIVSCLLVNVMKVGPKLAALTLLASWSDDVSLAANATLLVWHFHSAVGGRL